MLLSHIGLSPRQGMVKFFELDQSQKDTGPSGDARLQVAALHRMRRALSQIRGLAAHVWSRLVLLAWRHSCAIPVCCGSRFSGSASDFLVPYLAHSASRGQASIEVETVFACGQTNRVLLSRVLTAWKDRIVALRAVRQESVMIDTCPQRRA
eukprot:8617809-Pyramimonas_sp.AAC.1